MAEVQYDRGEVRLCRNGLVSSTDRLKGGLLQPEQSERYDEGGSSSSSFKLGFSNRLCLEYTLSLTGGCVCGPFLASFGVRIATDGVGKPSLAVGVGFRITVTSVPTSQEHLGNAKSRWSPQRPVCLPLTVQTALTKASEKLYISGSSYLMSHTQSASTSCGDYAALACWQSVAEHHDCSL